MATHACLLRSLEGGLSSKFSRSTCGGKIVLLNRRLWRHDPHEAVPRGTEGYRALSLQISRQATSTQVDGLEMKLIREANVQDYWSGEDQMIVLDECARALSIKVCLS